MINRLIKKKGAPLTWGPEPSNDPGSEAIAASAAVAVAAVVVVAATGAPGGDHPQVLLAVAGPMSVVVVVAADPMVVVAADPMVVVAARPGHGSRLPRPHRQSADASGSRPPRPQRGGGGLKQAIRRHVATGIASLPPTPRRHLGQRSYLQPLCPCPRGGGPRRRCGKLWRGRWEPRRQTGGLRPARRRSGSRGGGPDRRSDEPPRRSRRESAAWPRSPSSALDHRRA
jgi:hypothetical protein